MKTNNNAKVYVLMLSSVGKNHMQTLPEVGKLEKDGPNIG